MKKVFVLFLLWFIAANLFALAANNRLNLGGDTAYAWQDPGRYSQTQSWNPVPLHNQWDSNFYVYIAKQGYAYSGSGLSNIAFFPLYPLLIRIFAPVFLWMYPLAGWFIATVSLFFALYFFYRLVKDFHPKIPALEPLVFLLIFPTAFFLNAIYSEALFLLLSVLALYLSRRGNFLGAALCAFGASLTRPIGFLLIIPLFIELIVAKKKSIADFFALLIAPLGPLFFFLYHYWRFGDFFLFFKVENAWGRSFAIDQGHLTLVSHASIVNLSMDILFLVVAVVAACYVLRYIRLSYGLYMLTTLGLAVSTGTLLSIGRFVLVLFPLYIAFASIKHTYTRLAIAFSSTLLFALYTLLFVNGYWAG